MKLRNKIIITILPPWFLSIVIFNFLNSYSLKEEIEKNLQNELTNVASYTSDRIYRIIDDAIARIEVIGSLHLFQDYFDLGFYDLISEKKLKENEIKNIFSSILEKEKAYLSCQIVDKNGKVLIDETSKRQKYILDKEYRKKIFFNYIPYSKNVQISHVFFNRMFNVYAMKIKYRLRDDGYTEGNTVEIEISISDVLKKLNELSLIKGAILAIHKKDGELIFPQNDRDKEKLNASDLLISSKVVIPYVELELNLLLNKKEGLSSANHFNYINIITLILILFTVGCLIYFLSQNLSRPVERLIYLIKNQDPSHLKNSTLFTEEMKFYGKEFIFVAMALDKMVDAVVDYNDKMKKIVKLESISEIAKQVSHDIRSPLAALNSMIRQDLNELPEEKRVPIRQQINRIQDIANLLLEKNKKTFTVNDMSVRTELLSSVIEEIITEKRLHYRSHLGLTIEGDVYDNNSYGIFAQINLIEMKRLLSNLVNNSVEALPDYQGKITIKLQAKNHNAVQVIVEDNGKGIPPDLLHTLGQEGVSYGKNNLKDSGNGLGLFHARNIVSEFNGTFNIESEVNKFTRIIITLPRVVAPKWFVPKIFIASKQAIVILDDDQGIHHTWDNRFKELVLKNYQIIVEHLSTPETFRKWVVENQNKYQDILYLCDYELFGHEESGLDLLEKFNLKNSILITSHYENNTIRERCEKLGIKLIPKMLAGFVPIVLKENPRTLKVEIEEINVHSI